MTSRANNNIPINKPSITDLEIEYVTDAIKNGWGEHCYDYIERLESSFAAHLGSKHAIATSSCTGAIHLALMALGVQKGDEVIVPDITWIASVAPILYIGAKPVLVDVLPDTWCIDPSKIEEAITPKTKAILVVHLYGNLVEMDEVMEIAGKHDLKILEDAAEGLGSVYKGNKAGSMGDVGVFSFHGTKTFTTGEGGMLVTNDEAIYDQVLVLNNHGRNSKDPDDKMYWMKEYGYKYKMSNLQAALGCAQVDRADELFSNKRQVFRWYAELFKETDKFQLNPQPAHVTNGYWLPTVLFDQSLDINRDDLLEYLKGQNIDARPFFYPLSSLPMFDGENKTKVSHELYYRGINLPSHHDLSQEDVKIVYDTICEFISK